MSVSYHGTACKAITLYPIWAWAIIHGPKRIENRSWPTSHRGLLAIHAGKTRKGEASDRLWLAERGIIVPLDIPTGAILGTVNVAGCVPLADAPIDDPFAEGPFCWLLDDVRAFPEPIPAEGKLSLWDCFVPKVS